MAVMSGAYYYRIDTFVTYNTAGVSAVVGKLEFITSMVTA